MRTRSKPKDPVVGYDRRWKRFLAATSEGDDRVVMKLADTLPLGPIDSTGGTALHVAARGGHEAAAHRLLDRGADPNARSNDGRSVLWDAALSGSLSVALRVLPGASPAELHAVVDAAAAGITRHRRSAADPTRAIALIEHLLDHAGVSLWSAEFAEEPLARSLAKRVLRDGPRLLPLLARVVREGGAVEALVGTPYESALAVVLKQSTRDTDAMADAVVGLGALIDAPNGARGVLHALAARNANGQEMARWIERGARLEARDADDLTPLALAASCGAVCAYDALLSLGAAPSAVSEAHRATLAEARERLANPSAGRRAVSVVAGAFAGFRGHAAERADGRYEVDLALFGRVARLTLEADTLRFD